jgi:hypothetical protein
MSYVIAIPSYNRADTIAGKTLSCVLDGGVSPSRITIFVANKTQEKMYQSVVPREMYKDIVVGKVGIANQRKFISHYYPVGTYIVSMDDDVEDLKMLRGDKLATIRDLDGLFTRAYAVLKKEKLYIWGIYPVQNPFFMHNTTTTNLKFIIGVTFGYINRRLKRLEPSPRAEGKEDYEQSILYYKEDGGVVRFNNITHKTKFNSVGGLGADRQLMNKRAAEYLESAYPDIVSIFHRKNGMTEIRLARTA